jgi:replicative DNA helicase
MKTANFQNLEAEHRVIGSLLLASSVFDEIADILNEHDFTDLFYAKVFSAIAELINNNKPVEVFSVIDCLRLNQEESARLIKIGTSTPTAANVKHFAERVKQASLDRQINSALEKAKILLHEQTEDRLDKIQQELCNINENKSTKPLLFTDIAQDVLIDIQERTENKNKFVGLRTGFIDLDNLTNGFKRSQLIILGARPSMGKSLISVNIAESAINHTDEAIAVFSLEMSKEELAHRIISSQTKIPLRKIQSGDLNNYEQNSIAQKISELCAKKIIIDDTAPLTTMQIKAKCRQIKRQYGLALVIIDYIGLIDSVGERHDLKVGKVTRDLKLLTKELKIPILALCQLSRKCEERNDKTPILSDLRDSGQIEQDADIVMFLYRDEVYNPQTLYKNTAELIIAKQRNGALGKVDLTFNGHICRFDNYIGLPIDRYKQDKPERPMRRSGFDYHERVN